MTDIRQLLPEDVYDALIGANSPSALNPFATIADLPATGWALTGNALVGGEKFGSTNAQPVDFYTNNIVRGRLHSGGTFVLGDTGLYTSMFTIYNNNGANNIQRWYANSGSERLRITDGGDVLANTTVVPSVAAGISYHFAGANTMLGSGDNANYLLLPRYSVGLPYAYVVAVQNSTTIGSAGFKFQTADGGVGVEKFAIEANSRVVIGSTSTNKNAQLYVLNADAVNDIAQFWNNSTVEAFRVQEDLAAIAFGGLYGTDAVSGDLILGSTTNALKGRILFGGSHYDEVNNFWGFGIGLGALSTIHNAGTLTESKWTTIVGGAYAVLTTDLNILNTIANAVPTLPTKAAAGTGKVFRFFAAPGITTTITANAADNIFGAATYSLVGGATGASVILRASPIANLWVLGD